MKALQDKNKIMQYSKKTKKTRGKPDFVLQVTENGRLYIYLFDWGFTPDSRIFPPIQWRPASSANV